MTDLVVLVLVALWIAVLSPRVVRRFRSRSQTSIESFHEQLHLLERTGPKLVAPAYRLETATTAPSATQLPRASSAPRSHSALSLLDRSMAWQVETAPRSAHAGRRPGPAQRRRGRRRRRDIVFGLAATAVITGALGVMHSLHVLWAVTGVAIVALAGYVALAAYVQMLDADRQALKTVDAAGPPLSPWVARRPRHAAGEPLFGMELLTGGPSQPWAARAGYPGAWDAEVGAALAARHVAAGG